MFEISAEDSFASAHQLVGYEGPCENLHGHTWKVKVALKGEKLDDLGMLFDFKQVKMLLKEILSEFDHKNLNEMCYFKDDNPTAENIAKTIFSLFGDKMKGIWPAGTGLSQVTVWESEKTCATYSL